MTDAPMGAGYTAPNRMTVVGSGWRADGQVIGRAPYSVAVAWQNPDGSSEHSWFVWEPGRAGHAKQHGMPADSALTIEAVE